METTSLGDGVTGTAHRGTTSLADGVKGTARWRQLVWVMG